MHIINNTTIVGMGALGMLYANLIQSTPGSPAVCFAANSERVEKYKGMRFTVNGTEVFFRVTDAGAGSPADLVILAVKYTALEAALESMAPFVGPDTTIISVMNGITSEQIIGERFGAEKVIGSVAQGMDAVKFDGALTYTMPGELRIGLLSGGSPGRLEALKEFFNRAGIAYTVEEDMNYRLWSKFMCNVGINQTCMAYETTYGGVLAPGKAHETFLGAMQEVVSLANLEGIPLSEADVMSYEALLNTLSPSGMPSMRQDGIAHRCSEVEMFSGTVRALAAKHKLAVPVNDWLYTTIKEMEAGW